MPSFEDQVELALQRAATAVDPGAVPPTVTSRALARRRRALAMVGAPVVVLVLAGAITVASRGSDPAGTNVTVVDQPTTATVDLPSTTMTNQSPTTTALGSVTTATPPTPTAAPTTAVPLAPAPSASVPYSCPPPTTTWTAPVPTAAGIGPSRTGGVTFVRGAPTRSELWWMKADGTQRTQLLEAGGTNSNPDISRDGARIVWDHDDQITVLDLRTGKSTRVTKCGVDLATSEWSPDGTRILFSQSGGRGTVPNLLIMNADGSGAHFLEFDGPDRPTPELLSGSWSPDGTRIVLSASDGLFVHDLATHRTIRIFDQRSSGPAWSPVDDTIVFSVLGEAGGQLTSVRADGTAATPLGIATRGPALPAWLADGSRLVYVEVDPAGTSAIVSIRPDGSDQTRLTPSGGSESAPGT